MARRLLPDCTKCRRRATPDEEDSAGHDTLEFGLDETLNFDLLLAAHQPAAVPAAGFFLYDETRNLVFSCGTTLRSHALPPLEPWESLVVRFSVSVNLRPGTYTVTLGVSDHLQPQDWHEGLGPLRVQADGGRPAFQGMANLPFQCLHTGVQDATNA